MNVFNLKELFDDGGSHLTQILIQQSSEDLFFEFFKNVKPIVTIPTILIPEDSWV